MSALSPHEKRTRKRPSRDYYNPEPIEAPVSLRQSGDSEFLAALRAAYPRHNKVEYGPIKRRAKRSVSAPVLDTARGAHPGDQGAPEQAGA
jgi:hypothetical protein